MNLDLAVRLFSKFPQSAVINLYNEQLKTVQNILARAMLNNIDDFRRNANILIGITMSALVFIALVEPFLFWANISELSYCNVLTFDKISRFFPGVCFFMTVLI